MAEALGPDDGWREKGPKQALMRKYMAEIRIAGLIGVDGETVTDLQKPTP